MPKTAEKSAPKTAETPSLARWRKDAELWMSEKADTLESIRAGFHSCVLMEPGQCSDLSDVARNEMWGAEKIIGDAREALRRVRDEGESDADLETGLMGVEQRLDAAARVMEEYAVGPRAVGFTLQVRALAREIVRVGEALVNRPPEDPMPDTTPDSEQLDGLRAQNESGDSGTSGVFIAPFSGSGGHEVLIAVDSRDRAVAQVTITRPEARDEVVICLQRMLRSLDVSGLALA